MRAPSPTIASVTQQLAPTITLSCRTARSTVERSPTEQWRPSTASGPMRAPLVMQPSYTSESVSSRGGRLLSTCPASRSYVASR
jgi:hypothetical protein